MKPVLATFAALLVTVLLVACSTPQPEHFYTLSGGADAQPAKPVKYYVEVLAVSVSRISGTTWPSSCLNRVLACLMVAFKLLPISAYGT